MSSAAKYILAIDLGTSGPKVALVSVLGDVIDHEFEKTDTLFLDRSGVEETLMTGGRPLSKQAKGFYPKILFPKKISWPSVAQLSGQGPLPWIRAGTL